MKPTARLSGFALLALALVGCGGNTGTQITAVSRNLDLDSGTSYADAAPVDTVEGKSVAPLASFTTKNAQQVVMWGSRDDEGRVTGVSQMVYAAPTVAPLYAKYNETGGLASVYDSDTKSYVTFGPLEGSSILCNGFDGTRNREAMVRATLSDIGVTVEVLSSGDRGAPRRQVVPLSKLDLTALKARTAAENDPLSGLTGVYHDPAERTRIITALIHAAGLVVEAPFDGILRDVAGFMLLDRFSDSYGKFLNKGGVPTVARNGATPPLSYRSDIP